jgi:hypothetical protein
MMNNNMEYQLVLQFSGDSINDLDDIVTLENHLIEILGSEADVDGHDIGSGQANIFIFTSDPAFTFESTKKILEHKGLLRTVTAAYREIDDDNYIVVWPKDSRIKFEIT